MIPKPSFCKSCPINHLTSQKPGEGYLPPKWKEGSILYVNDAPSEEEARSGIPFCDGAGQWLRNLSKGAGLDFSKASSLSVIGCRPPEDIFPTSPEWRWGKDAGYAGVFYCRDHHLLPSLRGVNSRKIVALGAQAMEALTPRSNILQWRGSPLPLKKDIPTYKEGKCRVIPTLSPSFLMRNASLSSVVIGDLKKSLTLPPERYNLFPTPEEVESFKSKEFAFDFEWDKDGNITLCGLSDRMYHCMVVPFYGSYPSILKGIFENATSLIGHNIINADLSYFEKLGWNLREDCKIHDTMLKQHLIQPDFKHGLDFVASVFTNKVFWKGKWGEWEDEGEGNTSSGSLQWKTWDQGNAIPREAGGYGGCHSKDEAFRLYNARDTDGEFQVNLPLSHLLRKYDMESTYWNVSVPVAYICREIGEKGWKIDSSRLEEVREEIDKEISLLEKQLPPGLAPYEEDVPCHLPAPPETYSKKIKKCKGKKKNDTQHETTLITFTHPGELPCPTCGDLVSSGTLKTLKIIKGFRKERILPYNSPTSLSKYVEDCKLKKVYDRKTGRETTGTRARKLWSSVEHPEFATLGLLKKEVTLKNNFAKDSLLKEERMYFNLKVHGTSEGRLASSGRRKGIDLNIQNQPKEFKIIYIPDEEGWSILSLDIIQGENMLTAWLAEDWERWDRLNTPGFDEHAELASRIFGRKVTKSKEDNALRQIGKKINHGRNYGMGVQKQRDELLQAGFEYSISDVKEFIEIWKNLNSGTAKWQTKTIAEVGGKGFLVNPFGRKRWFSNRDYATKALAFLPASTLADMVLRMMVGHYPSRFRKEIHSLKLNRFFDLQEGWRMAAQVHDEIALMGPSEGIKEQASSSLSIMSQEWPELNGFHFGVDIKSSSKSWGECKSYII